MMQVAGTGIAAYLDKRFKADGFETALGLIGKGNNGGDTIIALTNLQKAGWTTMALIAIARDQSDPLLLDYQAGGGVIVTIEALPDIYVNSAGKGLVLDGIFGSGFHVPLADNVAETLQKTRAALPGFKWIAVDCPSGVDCLTGEVSEGTVKADVTVCLEAVKPGLLRYTAFPFVEN